MNRLAFSIFTVYIDRLRKNGGSNALTVIAVGLFGEYESGHSFLALKLAF